MAQDKGRGNLIKEQLKAKGYTFARSVTKDLVF